MSEITITPTTKRSQLPTQLSDDDIHRLTPDVFYPACVYLAAFGLRTNKTVIEDYERGIINPDEVRFRGRMKLFHRRKPGEKVGMMIRGREIRRVVKEGRQVGFYAKELLRRMEGGYA